MAVYITLDKLSIVVGAMHWTLGWVFLLVTNNFSFANVVMFHHHGQRPDSDLWGGWVSTHPIHVNPHHMWASARMFMCTIVPAGFKLTCHSGQSLVYNVCSFGRLVSSASNLVSQAFITACVLFNLLIFCNTIFNLSIYSSPFAYL